MAAELSTYVKRFNEEYEDVVAKVGKASNPSGHQLGWDQLEEIQSQHENHLLQIRNYDTFTKNIASSCASFKVRIHLPFLKDIRQGLLVLCKRDSNLLSLFNLKVKIYQTKCKSILNSFIVRKMPSREF
jgi:hypothetical protein